MATSTTWGSGSSRISRWHNSLRTSYNLWQVYRWSGDSDDHPLRRLPNQGYWPPSEVILQGTGQNLNTRNFTDLTAQSPAQLLRAHTCETGFKKKLQAPWWRWRKIKQMRTGRAYNNYNMWQCESIRTYRDLWKPETNMQARRCANEKVCRKNRLQATPPPKVSGQPPSQWSWFKEETRVTMLQIWLGI